MTVPPHPDPRHPYPDHLDPGHRDQRQADPHPAALDFLLSRWADEVPHLNGTLLAHLLATEELLRSWGSSEELCLAGLCHAVYGTDGFAPYLVPSDDRGVLPALVGAGVEETVYLYASCDRSVVYPQLAGDGPVLFRDRFRQQTVIPTDAQLRDFVDLTLANELDVAGQVEASDPPGWIGPLVALMETRASPRARRGARDLLRRDRAGRSRAGR